MSGREEKTAALCGRNIQKIFKRNGDEIVRALDDVSLEVQAGTLTALVGPDGAGKTTLIRLAAGLMTADAGELRVLGIDVSAAPQRVQDRLGSVATGVGHVLVQRRLNGNVARSRLAILATEIHADIARGLRDPGVKLLRRFSLEV